MQELGRRSSGIDDFRLTDAIYKSWLAVNENDDPRIDKTRIHSPPACREQKDLAQLKDAEENATKRESATIPVDVYVDRGYQESWPERKQAGGPERGVRRARPWELTIMEYRSTGRTFADINIMESAPC